TVTYTLAAGALGSPRVASYSSGSQALPIPDLDLLEVPIEVTDDGIVEDVNVSVRLDHTFDSDLVLSLVHPDGTVVALATNRGGEGDNFGAGPNSCLGSHTRFDDGSLTTIASGVAPFL